MRIESPIAIPKARLQDLSIEAKPGIIHLPRDSTKVLALPEVYIELSCINLLRQHLNRQRYNDTTLYSHDPAFQGSAEAIMHKANLCFERLREVAMCRGDMSTVLQKTWDIEGQDIPGSALDFNTKHKCRDFKAISSWIESNEVRAVKMNNLWWGGKKFY